MREGNYIPVALLWVVALSATARSAEFYLAPTGSNGNNGESSGAPWGTFDFAIDQINPGDTLYVLDGTFNLSSQVRIRSNEGGTAANPIRILAAPGANPVLDFLSMNNSWGSSSGRGIQVDEGADWLHVKGLTIQHARDNGIHNEGNNSIFEQLTLRWNGDSGFQLSGLASNNLVLNTDSYENYDPNNNGENADGFAAKFEDLGPGNVIRGSRAWGNSDDGWDMWNSQNGVLIEDSWAYDNGKIIDKFYEKELLEANNLSPDNFNGDGNGYKLGHDAGPHILNRVLAWQNEVRGIDVNGNGFGVTVSNSTVFDSDRNWQFDETAEETDNQHVLRNNISFAGSRDDIFLSGVTDSFNTWNGIPVSAADFLSFDDAIARGPRNADGSLPISDFLRLAPGSNLIDAGIDVGLPFTGAAPDLGAFEISDDADFNFDYQVDGDDLAVLEASFGLANGAMRSLGDSNLDGVVNGMDFLDWLRGYNGSVAVAAATVPEPSMCWLLAGAALLVRMSRRSGRTF